MNDLTWGILIGLVAAIAVYVIWFFLQTRGDFPRYTQSQQIARRWQTDAEFAAKVDKILNPEPPKPVKPSGAPLRLLAPLQREGRLLDFLLEDITAYSNEQIGVAVRDIHRTCGKALHDHLVLEPVMKEAEGETAKVPAGFDPSAIRLVGNVTGQPPFHGILRHHGWRVEEMKLAAPAEGQDEFVVAPAEVELA